MFHLIPRSFSSIKWGGRSVEDPDARYLSIFFGNDRAVEIILNQKFKDIILRDVRNPQRYASYNYIRRRDSVYEEFKFEYESEKEALKWIFEHIENVESNPYKVFMPLDKAGNIKNAMVEMIPKVEDYIQRGTNTKLLKECNCFQKIASTCTMYNGYTYSIDTSKISIYGILDYLYVNCPSLYNYMMTVMNGKDMSYRAFGFYLKRFCV